MASAGSTSVLLPAFGVVSTASVAWGLHTLLRADVKAWATQFLTGPGRTSRILLVGFVLTNLKSLPLAWTVRFCSPTPSSLPRTQRASKTRQDKG